MKTTLEQIFENDQKQHQTAFTISIPITRDQVETIVIGALEGGSNYWYWLEEIPANTPSPREPLSLRIVEGLLSVPGYTLPVEDLETREVVGSLTIDSLQKAIAKTAKERPNIFQDLMDNDLGMGI